MDPISVTNSMIPNTSTGTLTAGMSASDARAVLDQLGINVNDVLSSGNIQSTVVNPTPRPDDLLGIRANLYNTLGVNKAQADLNAASQAAASAVTGLNKDLTSLSGRPVSLSKITGQQGQLAKIRQGDIQVLQDAERNLLNIYNAKKGEADAQLAIREAEISDKRTLQRQYPGAGIDFNDDNTKILQKITQYQKDQKKELYKDSLKEKALALGLSTKGSRKALESRIKKRK